MAARYVDAVVDVSFVYRVPLPDDVADDVAAPHVQSLIEDGGLAPTWIVDVYAGPTLDDTGPVRTADVRPVPRLD